MLHGKFHYITYLNVYELFLRLSSQLPAHAPLLMLDGQSILGYNEYEFVVSPREIGKYVLILEYSSDCEHMHTIEAAVANGREYDDVKFNIYTCDYAFLCRQVALSSTNEVMVSQTLLVVYLVIQAFSKYANMHGDSKGEYLVCH